MSFTYTGDPTNNPIDALRLLLGDLDDLNPIYQDEELSYFLDSNKDNVHAAFYQAAVSILPKFARYSRERSGQIEVYGGDYFTHYLAWLKFISKPNSPAFAMADGGMYYGGIDKEQTQKYFLDPSIVSQPFYRGQFFRMPNHMGYRRLTPSGFAEVDENGRLLGFHRDVALPLIVDEQDQPEVYVGGE